MPPSTIPQAQVQAMIAELRQVSDYGEVPKEYAQPQRFGARRLGLGALGLLLAGAVLGAAVGFLGPSLGLFERRPVQVPDTAPLALTVSKPTPIQPVPAAPPTPAPALLPAEATAKPVTLRPSAPSQLVQGGPVARPQRACLAGGPCGAADVSAAERRLQRAIAAADKRGVSDARLNSIRQRARALKQNAAERPRTTIAGYRKLASELAVRPKRSRAAPAAQPMIPYRRSR